jgi:hypothetical protein
MKGSIDMQTASISKRTALFALVVLGCVGPGHHGGLEREALRGPAPWTALPVRDADDDFSFAIVTDRTGEHRDGVFESAIGKLNLLMPAFVVSVGDLIEGYSEDEVELSAQWSEFQGFVAGLRMPFFYAAGNHDYSNRVMSRIWRERFGPSYYHFLYKGVLFLVLNSELFSSVSNPGHPVEGPDTQQDQLAFASHVLEEHRDARWTIVLIHQPLWDRPEPHPDWRTLEALLGERPYSVFAGHFHTYTKQERHDRRFITLATTGGGSRLRGFDRGEFDHVALVHMSDDGPVIANLMLDGIRDEDVRTEAHREAVRRLDRALAFEPGPTRPLGFRAGSVSFRVRNEGAAPLEIEGRFESGPDLRASPERVSLRVEPGGEASVPVALRAQRPLDLGAAAPALAHWRLVTQEPGASRVEVRQETWLLPEARFEVARAPRKVVVDGALGEWARLPFAGQARPSREREDRLPAGGAFRFGVSYDDDFVYVGVDVTDPTPFFASARSERKQDAVSITLDARPDPARSANQGFFGAISSGSMAKLAIAWLVPGEPLPDPIFGALLPTLPQGTQQAVRRTRRGYAAELAIPRAFLDERQGGPWSAFRLEVSQQDYDADGRDHVVHGWRPSRFGTSDALPIPGSGTFVRAGGPSSAR